MSGWQIYLITRLDAIQIISFVLSLLLGAILLLSVVFTYGELDMNYESDRKKREHYLKRIKKLVIVLVLAVLTAVITPSSKEMAVIYVLPKIIANEDVQEIPANAMELLNKKLKQWLEED